MISSSNPDNVRRKLSYSYVGLCYAFYIGTQNQAGECCISINQTGGYNFFRALIGSSDTVYPRILTSFSKWRLVLPLSQNSTVWLIEKQVSPSVSVPSD